MFESEPVINVLWDAGADRTQPLPFYASSGAAGADIRANFPPAQRNAGVVLGPGGRALLPTGLRLEIPMGFEVQIRPRSGLALKHGITLLNAPGTIDSDYRGPLGVILLNTSEVPFAVTHGSRIAQMIVAPVARARFLLAEVLGKSERGSGGFGSTGQG
ncbi:MAG: dUTP diphosphatase [Halocynthiibacter sp.]